MHIPALIPLSREHHYALVLCLTLSRGLEAHVDDADWLMRWSRNAVQFFALDMKLHFEAEEQVIFPACRALKMSALVDELIAEHREMEGHVAALERLLEAPINRELHAHLEKLHTALEAHIRKEERQLFRRLDVDVQSQQGETLRRNIERRLGRAENPRHPELLEDPRSS